MERKCPDLYRVVEIPQCDIESGRHSMARCAWYNPECHNPVMYRVTVIADTGPCEYLDTQYFCRDHKPVYE